MPSSATHFAAKGSESVETRKLHSVKRLGACLVFQKLLGLLAGCPSSGPPHLPTPVSGPSSQVPNRAPSLLGPSASASPVLAEVRQFHGRGRGLLLLGTLTCTPVVEGCIDRGSDAGQVLAASPPHKLGSRQVSGPHQKGRDSCLPWAEGTSEWAIFPNKVPSQSVVGDTCLPGYEHTLPGL